MIKIDLLNKDNQVDIIGLLNWSKNNLKSFDFLVNYVSWMDKKVISFVTKTQPGVLKSLKSRFHL